MREYYARFFGDVRKSVFLFWKGQVAVSLAAGVITATVNAISGVTPERVAVASVIAVVGGYLVVLGLAFMCSVMCAPVNLDRQRVTEINVKESSISEGRSEIAALKVSIKSQIATKQAEISGLEELLLKKHPHNEFQETVLAKALTALNSQERDAITWLLDAGETPRGKLQQMGLDVDALFNRSGFPPLLAYRSFRPGNQITEIDRFYYINPNMADSLRNVLYPPLQPVTSPQA